MRRVQQSIQEPILHIICFIGCLNLLCKNFIGFGKSHHFSHCRKLLFSDTDHILNAIDIGNHIVVVWYQIVRELLPCLKLSKQFLHEATKKVQTTYIESICELFDLDLYYSYNGSLLRDIPEFNDEIINALYKLFIKEGYITRCTESVLSDAIYSFSNGNVGKYSTEQISREIKNYIVSKGEKYSPPEYELLDLLLQSYS